MQVALPSGHSATFRDTFLRGDVREARRGMVFVIGPDGSRTSDGSFLDGITGRMIGRMLVEWDLGTRPGDCATEELAQQVLDALPEDDYAALEAAVGPWVEKVLSRGKTDTYVHVATGLRFELAAGQDAAKAQACPDFRLESAEGPDPKTSSRAIGTSSSASPAPDGRTETSTTPPTST